MKKFFSPLTIAAGLFAAAAGQALAQSGDIPNLCPTMFPISISGKIIRELPGKITTIFGSKGGDLDGYISQTKKTEVRTKATLVSNATILQEMAARNLVPIDFKTKKPISDLALVYMNDGVYVVSSNQYLDYTFFDGVTCE